MPLSQESKVTIKIPRALYRRLKEILDGSGFDSVTDFIVYVLRDIASSEGIKRGSLGGIEGSTQLTAEEVEKVRARLRKLGYL